MTGTKADIIAQLQREILSLQGFKTTSKNNVVDAMLGPIKSAFPQASFPLAAIHEFISGCPEDTAATGGFIAGMLAALMHNQGASIWISASRNIFPPALKTFGISPEKIIFIDLKKEKQILWVMEEALKCTGLCAVVGEMQELNFTASRRLQLAVEQSQVTGFILRRNPRSLNTTACVTRWKITSLPSVLPGNMPGVGFPRWNVDLLKVRNGRPDNWKVEFITGCLKHISVAAEVIPEQKKKAV